jgi:hypothetical protein
VHPPTPVAVATPPEGSSAEDSLPGQVNVEKIGGYDLSAIATSQERQRNIHSTWRSARALVNLPSCGESESWSGVTFRRFVAAASSLHDLDYVLSTGVDVYGTANYGKMYRFVLNGRRTDRDVAVYI